jgi:hypothetical protein
MVILTMVALVALVAIGVFYLHLHSLPEKLAHRQNHGQLELVTVLTLLALFTHNNVFWVLAILLVMIRPPDFLSPLKSIAQSLQQLAKKSGDQTQAQNRVEEDKACLNFLSAPP